MDSSSDGSFAWVDASDDSDESEMVKSNMNTSQSGEESESGKTYKKKLQRQLFSGSKNDETTLNGTEANQQRKRKLSQHLSDAENISSSKKKRIKTEPESDDFDKQSVKKKHRASEIYSQDSLYDPHDESFLDLKVKNEQNFSIPSSVRTMKKKKKSESSVKDTSMSDGDIESQNSLSPIESKGIHNNQTHYKEDSSHLEEDGNQSDTHRTKKKKKKSKRKKEHSDDDETEKNSVIRDSFNAEESVVEEFIDSQVNESADGRANCHDIVSDIQNDKMDTDKKTSKDNQEKVSNGNVTPIESRSQTNSGSVSVKKSTQKLRMSERLTFEDEEYSDVQSKSRKPSMKTTNNKTLKLDNFIKSNSNFQPVSATLPSALVLGDDDDVWVIKCPREVKVEAFQDKKWVLDSKCKIKLDGKAYEGDMDDKKSNMTILSARNGKSIIKNVTVNGCIRLRRRIPKIHIQEDNIMIDNQNNFIPLPETKVRHPLFGLNYKKAIKIPPAVVERLQAPRAQTAVSAGKAKRQKDRRKSESHDLSTAADMELEHDDELELDRSAATSKKKKKKRKHSGTEDERSAPRHKRPRHDLASVEAWDSEKAIEENLFNF